MATVPNPDAKNDAKDPKDQGELVEVFATQQDSEAMVVQSLLESAGIGSLLSADVGPQDVLPVGGVVVRVAPEDPERARQLISESQGVSDVEMLDQSESNAGPTETAG
jgi:hypothetical protein